MNSLPIFEEQAAKPNLLRRLREEQEDLSAAALVQQQGARSSGRKQILRTFDDVRDDAPLCRPRRILESIHASEQDD